MTRLLVLLGIFAGLTAASLRAAPLPAPSFSVSFDQGKNADHALGRPDGRAIDPKGQILSEIPLTDGFHGRALLAGAAAVQYATPKNLAPAAGTVALWFRALTWAPLDDQAHYLFSTDYVMDGDQPISHLALYKLGAYALTPWSNSFQLHVTGSRIVAGKRQVTRNNFAIPHAVTDSWSPGQWHFLAFTFDQKVAEVVLYADGVEAARARQNLPESFGPEFAIGGRFEQPTSTAIAEVRLWTEALTPHQIRQLYRENVKGSKPGK